MPPLFVGLAWIAIGLVLIYLTLQVGTRQETGQASASHWGLPDRLTALTFVFLCVLVVFLFLLWLRAGGDFIFSTIGDNHTMYMVGHNIRDFITLFLIDHAASPDPAAHPYLYTHNAVLVPRLISFGLQGLGVSFEGQNLVAVLISVVGVAIAYVALRRLFTPLYATAFVFALALSYRSFVFNAGNIFGAYLFFTFCLLLLALSHNPRLDRAGWNAFIAIVTFVAASCDWEFVGFFVAFGAFWVTYENARILWRRVATVLVAPAALCFFLHEAVALYAVGWHFFFFDIATTYFDRVVWPQGHDESEWLSRYRAAHVVSWHIPAIVTGLDLPRSLVRSFWESGGLLAPLDVALLGLSAAYAASRRHWSAGSRVLLAVPALCVFAGILPAIMLALSAVVLVLHLSLTQDGKSDRLARASCFGLIVVASLATAFAVFPQMSSHVIWPLERPPSGIPQATLLALVAMSAARGMIAQPAPGGRPALYPWHGAAIVIMLILVLAALNAPPLGFALVTFPVAFGWALMAWSERQAGVFDEFLERVARQRVLYSVGLAVAGAMLAILDVAIVGMRPSLTAGLFGTMLLLASCWVATGAATRFTVPRLRPADALSQAFWHIAGRTIATPSLARLAVALFALEIGWTALSVVRFPPAAPPYAAILRESQYQGRSFLVWTSDAVVWLYTRGWTYTADANPPDLTKPNLRWRHFADWQNEAKYSHPDFFLCDNGQYRWDVIHSREMICRIADHCDCMDVASFMAKQGHKIEVATPDYSIIRFSWSAP